ncbi:Hydrogen peroxide-inducible genes activator [Thalassoglobus neptunius]|uniref:Hydrogen peroxide-inducible genes activator n=1 Tax=Thalassoglobus neptunius TaxID=1938619 RepID=A0A5C5WYX1_9PLAN|nr:LysR family transcriptional regulator [Thalassoglobus neptunius]TWT55291.1 Hydrogen peroxide-inducible genes activator [Thalassoglobus neptunius]
MELDQLRHFVSVARTQNFTQAANQCGMSQSTISRSVGRLEEELGQPVFDRQTRKVVLTDAGRILLPRAETILSLVDDLKREIQDDGETGRIRIGAIPTIAPYYLPKVLSRFNEQFPEATLVVQEDTTSVLLKQLADGAIDVAVLARPIDSRHLEIESLFEEELDLVMAADHPLQKKKNITISDLEGIPFVLLSEAHCLTGNVRSFCEQRAVCPLTIEKTSQLASVQELVSLNHGISLIPRMARQRDHDKSRAYRTLTDPKPTRVIAMAWNPYRFQSRLIETFKQHLRDFKADDAIS